MSARKKDKLRCFHAEMLPGHLALMALRFNSFGVWRIVIVAAEAVEQRDDHWLVPVETQETNDPQVRLVYLTTMQGGRAYRVPISELESETEYVPAGREPIPGAPGVPTASRSAVFTVPQTLDRW